MAEIWPPILNYVLDRGSFSIEPQTSVIRSEFDDGPKMARMRFTNPTTNYNGTLTFTNEEFMVFRGFFMNVLSQGTRWFTIPIWQGNTYAIHKARFTKTYEIKDEGWDQYTVTISLEVRNYFTYNTFASYIIGLYGTDFAVNEFADPLQIIVNVTYPNIFRGRILIWDTDSSTDTFVWDKENGQPTELYWDGWIITG